MKIIYESFKQTVLGERKYVFSLQTMRKLPKHPVRPAPDYVTNGTVKGEIDVKISYRIIQLFSEGLYASPNKAIEELVSNSFDAGAENVHVIMSPDLGESGATIVVIDDGEGMDQGGLANHWIIGQSGKRDNEVTQNQRKPIGKFGIGKLATYVLANRLSHISKSGGKYYATSMDYRKIPNSTESEAGQLEDLVQLPLRELSESEAKKALQPWTVGEKPGYVALQLFDSSRESWTVAIMSELKEMVNQITLGRLKWVLSTAMPIRPDFNLFLSGDKIESSKLKGRRIGSWELGKTVKTIPKPAPTELEVSEAENVDPSLKFGLVHSQLGRITGRIELFEDLLTGGKSESAGRSWGIFVFVRGRLVNADDPYFGISSNKLRHGTLSRFRLEIHIDRLDDELRSSRETIRESSLLKTAQNLMEGCFNFARRKHEEFDEEVASGRRATTRVADSPASLTRTPLLKLIAGSLEGNKNPQLTRFPDSLDAKAKASFIEQLEKDSSSEKGLINQIIQSPLGQHYGIAIYDSFTRILEINSLHPFVAYFGDEFSDKKQNLPLELLATSEVLLEASMYDLGIKESHIRDVMIKRDSLLRELARSTGKRNALMIAADLQEAANDQDKLIDEAVAAFDSLGFSVVRIGGKGKRAGLAQAFLSSRDSNSKAYNVSIEVREKLKPGLMATANTLGLKRILSHRDNDFPTCQHAFVLVADFPRNTQERTALLSSIRKDTAETDRTVTFARIKDFVRLVQIAPAKRLSLKEIRSLFNDCILPDEVQQWVENLSKTTPSTAPYREILDAIFEEQQDMPLQTVEYTAVEVILRKAKNVVISKEEIISLCNAMHRIVPEFVYASNESVSLTGKPSQILRAFNSAIRDVQ